MLFPSPFAALVVSLSAWLGATFDAPPEPQPVVQRMIVRDEIIIHVPIAHDHPLHHRLRFGRRVECRAEPGRQADNQRSERGGEQHRLRS